MTKYKAQIKMAEKPFNIIKWFTKHWDKEIGALGIGEMKDGELYVERLLFPKQKVSGSHVHFKPEDWGSIVRELTDEEFSKIIFYWHKHPDNMPGASQGDEDETFDVFMPIDTDRPFFGFLQTSQSRNGGMEYEGRIEMRQPLFASITDVELLTIGDESIIEECNKIIEDCVTEGYASGKDQPGFKEEKSPEIKNDIVKPIAIKREIGDEDDDIDKDPIFTAYKKNGQVLVKISTFFETWVDSLLEEMDDNIDDIITEFPSTGEDYVIKIINPKKKKYSIIFDYFKNMENTLHDNQVVKSLEKTLGTEESDKEKIEAEKERRVMETNWLNDYRRGWGYR